MKPDRSTLAFCSVLFVVMTMMNLVITYVPANYRIMPSVIGGGVPVFTFGTLAVLLRTFRQSDSARRLGYFLINCIVVSAFGFASGLIHFACLPKLK